MYILFKTKNTNQLEYVGGYMKKRTSKYNFEGLTFNNIQVLKRNTDIQQNGCFYYVFVEEVW